MGFDQPKSLGSHSTGSRAALPIWLDFMKVALKGKPETPPGPMPDGLGKITRYCYFSVFPPGKAVDRVGRPAHPAITSNGSHIDRTGRTEQRRVGKEVGRRSS